MSADCGLSLFAVEGTREYGERIARHLDLTLGAHEERGFEDGEHKIRPLTEVRRQDVFVIHSLYGDTEQSPSDKLCRLLFFVGALKDAGAERVTAVVVTLDLHNVAAFENAFRCPTTNLEAIPLFVEHFAGLLRHERLAVVSPDIGGAKRAEEFRRALAAELRGEPTAAFVEKRRALGVVSGQLLVGEVQDRAVIIFDDLISTGNTLLRAARSCRDAGATRIFAAATHGLFIGQAPAVLADPVFEGIAVADTVRSLAAAEGRLPRNVGHLDSSRLVAGAIIAAHAGR